MKKARATAAEQLPGMSESDWQENHKKLTVKRDACGELARRLHRRKNELIARGQDTAPVQKELDDALHGQADAEQGLQWLQEEGRQRVQIHNHAESLKTLIPRRQAIQKRNQ